MEIPLHGSRIHKLRVLAAFLCVCIIWGTTFIAIRFAIDSIPPFLMAGTRFSIAGLLLYLWERLRGAPSPRRLHWLLAGILGTLLLVFGNLGVVLAEKTIPTGLVSLLVTMTPVYVVLVNWLRPSGTRPSARIFLGLLMGIAGMIALVGPTKLLGGQSIDLLGVVCVSVGCFGFATGTVFSRIMKLPHAQLSTAMQMLTAGAILLVVSMALGEPAHFQLQDLTWKAILSVAYLIVFGSLIAYSAYVWLLRHVSPARVSTYTYVNPIVAVFLGWAMGGESLSIHTMIAASIILFAVWLVTGAKQNPVQEIVVAKAPKGELELSAR